MRFLASATSRKKPSGWFGWLTISPLQGKNITQRTRRKTESAEKGQEQLNRSGAENAEKRTTGCAALEQTVTARSLHVAPVTAHFGFGYHRNAEFMDALHDL